MKSRSQFRTGTGTARSSYFPSDRRQATLDIRDALIELDNVGDLRHRAYRKHVTPAIVSSGRGPGAFCAERRGRFSRVGRLLLGGPGIWKPWPPGSRIVLGEARLREREHIYRCRMTARSTSTVQLLVFCTRRICYRIAGKQSGEAAGGSDRRAPAARRRTIPRQEIVG